MTNNFDFRALNIM